MRFDLDITSEGSEGRDLHVCGVDRLVLKIALSLVNLTVALLLANLRRNFVSDSRIPKLIVNHLCRRNLMLTLMVRTLYDL